MLHNDLSISFERHCKGLFAGGISTLNDYVTFRLSHENFQNADACRSDLRAAVEIIKKEVKKLRKNDMYDWRTTIRVCVNNWTGDHHTHLENEQLIYAEGWYEWIDGEKIYAWDIDGERISDKDLRTMIENAFINRVTVTPPEAVQDVNGAA